VVEDELLEDGRVGDGGGRRHRRDLDGEDGEQEDDQGVAGPMLPPGLGEEPAPDEDDSVAHPSVFRWVGLRVSGPGIRGKIDFQ